jgi:hypothetical protein
VHLHSQHVFPSALQPAGAGQHCSLYATHGSANASGMGHADRSPQEKAGNVHSKYSAAALTRTAHTHSTHTPQPPQIPRQQGKCAANASDEDCCCEQYAAAHTPYTQNLASKTLQHIALQQPCSTYHTAVTAQKHTRASTCKASDLLLRLWHFLVTTKAFHGVSSRRSGFAQTFATLASPARTSICHFCHSCCLLEAVAH